MFFMFITMKVRGTTRRSKTGAARRAPGRASPARRTIDLRFHPPNSNTPLAIPMDNARSGAEWRRHLVDAHKKISTKPVRVNTTLYRKGPVITVRDATAKKMVGAILDAVRNEPRLSDLVLHSLWYDPKRRLYTVGFDS